MNLPGWRLTSADPEPPVGSIVRDAHGVRWEHDGEDPPCWLPDLPGDHDPESWIKVAGNYGPVVLVHFGEAEVPLAMLRLTVHSPIIGTGDRDRYVQRLLTEHDSPLDVMAHASTVAGKLEVVDANDEVVAVWSWVTP